MVFNETATRRSVLLAEGLNIMMPKWMFLLAARTRNVSNNITAHINIIFRRLSGYV